MSLFGSLLTLLIFALYSCNPLDDAKLGDTLKGGKQGEGPIEPVDSRVLPPGITIDAGCDAENLLAPLGFDDPYAGCLWHVINRGQYIKRLDPRFSDEQYFSKQGTTGSDLYLTSYALEKYSGKGVKVHVADTGLAPDHEDFAENFDLQNSKSCDEFGVRPIDSGKTHGIMVSGVIGAVGKNGIGVSGIAYQSSVSGYNAFSCDNFVFAIDTPEVDIWNGSYGIPSCAAHTREVSNLYQGYMVGGSEYGVLYFKSAGNGRRPALNCNAGYGDSNRDPSNTHPYVFPIAALDNELNVTSYSTPGSSIFLSAPAGYGGRSDSPGICTISKNNSYTCSMNGTSVASPNVAAVAALVKEANPRLSNIDIAYILAKTARKIDEPETQNSNQEKSFSVEGKSYINWSENSAGFFHSYNAGFGIPNVDKAVKLAESYQDYLSPLSLYRDVYNISSPESDLSELSVPSRSCVNKTVSVNENFQVFTSRIALNISGTARNLVIFMNMPDGTRSQIVRDSEIGGSGYVYAQKFKSYAPMGTNAKGDWLIEVCNNGNGTATYKSAQIELWGYQNLSELN